MKIGILPCAGKGSRLAPYIYPKELFPLGTFVYSGDIKPKPVVLYAVESMIKAGVKKIFFVINSQKLSILNFFRDGSDFGFRAVYMFQDSPLGSGDSVTLPYNFISKRDLVYIQMPDNVLLPTSHFIKLTRLKKKKSITIGTFSSRYSHFFGRIQKNELYKSWEKPGDTDIVLGSAVVDGYTLKNLRNLVVNRSDQIINKHDPQKEVRFSTLISLYEEENRRRVYYHYFSNGECIDISKPESLTYSLKTISSHRKDLESPISYPAV